MSPTAAAELATPDRNDLRAALNDQNQRLERAALGQIAAQRWQLNEFQNRLLHQNPLARIRNDRQRLDELTHRTGVALSHQMKLERSQLFGLVRRLEALSPLAILQRGYAVVSTADGSIVHSAGQINPGDRLDIRVHEGQFPVEVAEK